MVSTDLPAASVCTSVELPCNTFSAAIQKHLNIRNYDYSKNTFSVNGPGGLTLPSTGPACGAAHAPSILALGGNYHSIHGPRNTMHEHGDTAPHGGICRGCRSSCNPGVGLNAFVRAHRWPRHAATEGDHDVRTRPRILESSPKLTVADAMTPAAPLGRLIRSPASICTAVGSCHLERGGLALRHRFWGASGDSSGAGTKARRQAAPHAQGRRAVLDDDHHAPKPTLPVHAEQSPVEDIDVARGGICVCALECSCAPILQLALTIVHDIYTIVTCAWGPTSVWPIPGSDTASSPWGGVCHNNA